jgi:hypothetical protein
MGAPGTTDGPWMVEPINDGETYQVTTGERTGFVVICETEWGGAEAEAIARQLAASPDLYDALTGAEEFIAGFEGDDTQAGVDGLLASIRAAIAKARGEA